MIYDEQKDVLWTKRCSLIIYLVYASEQVRLNETSSLTRSPVVFELDVPHVTGFRSEFHLLYCLSKTREKASRSGSLLLGSLTRSPVVFELDVPHVTGFRSEFHLSSIQDQGKKPRRCFQLCHLYRALQGSTGQSLFAVLSKKCWCSNLK